MNNLIISCYVIQLFGFVYSNQPNTYKVTPEYSLTATTDDTFILKSRIQCVLRCKQNDSCYAVNIQNQGENYVCGILGIPGFLNTDVESSVIGMCHYVLINLIKKY